MPIGGHFENALEPISEQEHRVKNILITRDVPELAVKFTACRKCVFL